MAKVFFLIIIKHFGDIRTWLALESKKTKGSVLALKLSSFDLHVCLLLLPLFFYHFQIPYLQLHYKFHFISSCVSGCLHC